MSVVDLNTLVLAKNWMPHSVFPLSTVSSQDAIVGYLTGKVDVVYWFDRFIKTPSRTDLRWPSVIVTKHAKKFRNEVKLGKQNLYYRDGGKCYWCDEPLTIKNMTFDHLVPKSHGGKNEWMNLVTCCKKCNTKKGNSMPHGQWSLRPHKKVYEPSYFQLLEMRKNFPVVIDDENWLQFLPNFSSENIRVRGHKPELRLVG